jgi:uncharacterized protein YyaL (SSP411 family)
MVKTLRFHHLLLCCLIGALSPLAFAGEDELSNQLKGHPSPYLAMHGDDPVHWQRWNRQTLALARRLNRPLFISSGYFSCHWCHVMQRESYRDPKVADLLNHYFVPVKIDRELNPALDAHLIEFVELLQGQSGWPLNVFLTPDGYPIAGMLYVPRDRFVRMLQQFHKQWALNEAQLRQAAHQAMDEWRQVRAGDSKRAPVAAALVPGLMTEIDSLKDELAGGFGQQNKFPMVSQLRALLYLRRQGKAAQLDDFIRLTLDRMASQGLHDNLAGGFFRYVTDPAWQTPHFEKMLYDNAQLAELYLDAAALYDSAHYRVIGLETVDFILRDMWTDEGAFIGSFSAVDSQGREGAYYLWTGEQLKKLLTDQEYAAVQAAWLGGSPADSEYGYLPRWQAGREETAKTLGWSVGKLDSALASARDKMLAARSQRELLPDDKVLAAWNGLALSALARAYSVTGDKSYVTHAERLAAYLNGRLWDGRQLLRARDGDKALGEASLEDYALVAQGLWDWGQAGGDRNATGKAVERLVRLAWQRYFTNGRWQQSDTPLVPMLDGRLAIEDGPLPSASAVISRLSREDPVLARDKNIQTLLADHLQQARAGLADAIFWYASYVELLADAQR